MFIIIFRRIHSWFSGFRKWRQWWSRLENPRQFNQTGLRRRIPKWHWRDQTFGSGFWRSRFQMMNLDIFRWQKKTPTSSSSPFLLFYFAKYHVRQSDYFSSTNKQKKPNPIPLLKNSLFTEKKSMMKNKVLSTKKSLIIEQRVIQVMF